MLLLFRDDGSIVHPAAIASAPGPTLPRDERPASPDMHFRKHLIQRWISDDVSATPKAPPRIATSAVRDPDEAQARLAHDHFAALDWEREEFEREMALHFVVNDLQLGLDKRDAATPPVRPAVRPKAASAPSRPLGPVAPTRSSTSTMQPLTPSSDSSTMPSLELPSSSRSPPSSPPPPRPTSLFASVLRSPPRLSPSVLSLPTSHFSSCTSSSGAAHSVSTPPSLVSQVGRKLATKFTEVVEAPRPRRHVSIHVPLFAKKRRLVVRGIAMDDERAVEGIRHWANGLGVVHRVSRTLDGALWIEFQDKRVAENVCCLQAQVQIPHVGRVVLDWAEGRHPG